MKQFKFILNGEIRELYAINLFAAVKSIITNYPELKSKTVSQINLKQVN
jgi:hypothetical protein